MSFWDFLRKKGKENAVADSAAAFIPVVADSHSDSFDASLHNATDAGHATPTDSGGGFSGGDGGGDGGGGS